MDIPQFIFSAGPNDVQPEPKCKASFEVDTTTLTSEVSDYKFTPA